MPSKEMIDTTYLDAVQSGTVMRVINNRYKIIKKLGEGGMGSVFLSEDRLYNNRQVALKTIRPGFATADTIEIFKREFEVMTRLKHPNLVQVYDFGLDNVDNVYFLTIEFVDGQHLGQWIDRHPQMSPEEKLPVFVSLLRAIEFIHCRGILHRDIKPENVMISDVVKVMDFGLSDLEKTDKSITKGTLLYFAPEVLQNKADERTDIFALGVTFYNLLTSQRIYIESTSSIFDILQDVNTYNHAHKLSLRNVEDTELREILAKMTAFDPTHRYQSCTEVIAEINEKLGLSFPFETEETRNAYVLGAGFVGREQELKQLINWLNNDDEHRTLFCVHGEAGIGKSRLYQEFQYYCQLQNISFMQGNCLELGQRTFGVFLPILSECLLHATKKQIQKYGGELKKLFPDHDRLHEIDANPKQDPKTERGLLIQNFTNLLLEFSISNRKTVLYFNDMQWTDEASIEALSELMFKLQNFQPAEDSCTLRIYVSSREEGMEKLEQIKAKNRLAELKLHPFDEKNVKSYISAVFGEVKLDASLHKSIPEINKKVGGNPFFLQELVKSLVEINLIIRHKHAWTLTKAIEKTKIPANLKDLIVSRINRLNLTSDENRILLILGLLHYPPTYEELNQIVTVNQAFLTKLQDQEIIISEILDEKIIYRTAHDLIREVVVSSNHLFDKLYLEKSHQHIAERLEAIHSENLEDYISELAYHYSEAENRQKALPYLEKAADDAGKNHHNSTALMFYDRLLEWIDKGETEKRIDILIKKNEVLHLTGRRSEGQSILDEALRLAEKINDQNRIALSNLELGILYWKKNDNKNAEHHLEISLKMLQQLDEKPYIARINNVLGIFYANRGDSAKAKEYFESALIVNQDINDRPGLATGFRNLGNLNCQNGDYEAALKCFEKEFIICEELDDKLGIAIVTGNMGLIHYVNKNYTAAIECHEKKQKTCQQFGDKQGMSNAFGNLGIVKRAEGKANEAMACYKQQLRLNQEMGDEWANANAIGNIGNLYYDKGDFESAIAHYKKKLKICKESGFKHGIFQTNGNMGFIYQDSGDLEAAMECYENQLTVGRELDDQRSIASAFGNMGNLLFEKCDYEGALDCYEKAMRGDKELGFKGGLTRWLEGKARCFFEQNNLSEAKNHTDKCVKLSMEISKLDTLFRARILDAKIDFRLNRHDKAVKTLSNMLVESEDKSDIAALNFELWKMENGEGKTGEGEKALELYLELYENMPSIKFKNRIEELKRATPARLQPKNSQSQEDDLSDAMNSFI